MGGQKLFHLFAKPLIHFIMLTGGTMPVAAATGNGVYGATVMAPINNRSESAAAAVNDILDVFFMAFGHLLPIKCQILGSIYPLFRKGFDQIPGFKGFQDDADYL